MVSDFWAVRSGLRISSQITWVRRLPHGRMRLWHWLRSQNLDSRRHSAFTQGLKHRWSFLGRRCEQRCIRPRTIGRCYHHPLPAVCGRLISQEDRDLLAFPYRDGGLGIINPTKLLIQYQASLEVTSALVSKILDREKSLENVAVAVREAKWKVASQSRKATSEAARHFSESRGGEVQHCMQLASEKGASSWLTCRPLKSHSFTLSKGEFWDGLALRYRWQPARLPSTCACGVSFSVAPRIVPAHWEASRHCGPMRCVTSPHTS